MTVTLIDRALRLLSKPSAGLSRAALRRYLQHYYGEVAGEDLEDRAPADLLGAALCHLELARRGPEVPLRLRVFNPRRDDDGFESTHTIVHVVTRDSPFLVDSIANTVNREGFTVHLIVHPVFRVGRGAKAEIRRIAPDDDSGAGGRAGGFESFIHAEIDRETDPQRLAGLGAAIEQSMENVRMAVEDWPRMIGAARAVADHFYRTPPPVPADEVAEASAFLDWLIDDNFTFLGYRDYKVVKRGGAHAARPIADSGLGILRGDRLPDGSRTGDSQPLLMGPRAIAPPAILCTKSSFRAMVHRPGYMDRVSVLGYDAKGRVVGERRFLGLYTSNAYLSNPREIPVLRRKIETVRNRSGFSRTGHAGKALLNILDTFPRDELFQATTEELAAMAAGILHLQERQRVRVFVRRDPYDRYLTCQVFVPRDRFDTRVRERIQTLLAGAFRGTDVEFNITLTEAPLARLYFMIHVEPGREVDYDERALELEIEQASRSWSDALHEALIARHGEETGNDLYAVYRDGFPAGYQETLGVAEGVADIDQLEAAARSGRLTPRLRVGADGCLNLRLFHPGASLPLSTVLPILENLGVFVLSESPYEVGRCAAQGPARLWIHDFSLQVGEATDLAATALAERFCEAVLEVWEEALENDELNQLVLRAGLNAAQVVLMRTYTKYTRQMGSLFSQRYVAEILAKHPRITRRLVELFEARFDPDGESREARVAARSGELQDALDGVESLDEDRVLRRYFNLIRATLRTNYFQPDADARRRSYLSIKLDPERIEGLPQPRPQYEIFVYSPRVEGVHLRGGKVARGGLRWSDRREDFRTEVLGLMKAQMVKNAVIVPVGAKGGFFVKHPPPDGDPARLRAEGVACYRLFIRGLLDVSDNRVGPDVVPPPSVVRYDDEDPYLVVAADKGTATFSDIANEVAAEYGFWLDDAFASGGSNGYDHKAMGITARGAWESVRHHFQRLGRDIQAEPFTVVGIGDMSGDVFGNGMLLSGKIKLVAAFDHRHIFVDPNPDPERSFAERERLFRLPASSWDDYDRARLSPGGGVYPRSAKSIGLSVAARKALGVKQSRLDPDHLIRALLRAPVDLLWNGGIGTYVKASAESHAEVGDRANDGVRVDADELRCKVVGEGGNLGITQAGRIQYALAGGRINADWIDNSGGVHTSDLEVNIKILLRELTETRKLGRGRRNALLRQMTGEVGQQVLTSNYRQARALSLAEADSVALLSRYAHLITVLERDGGLERRLERLPDQRTLERRARAGRGLSRPELAVLVAYAKNVLYKGLLASSLPDDPYLESVLVRYFPAAVRRRRAAIRAHQLRREIVSTVIANSVVNRAGPVFAHRLADDTGRGVAEVTGTYLVARDALDLPRIWASVDALDFAVPYDVQSALVVQTWEGLERAVRWLLRHGAAADMTRAVQRYGEARRRIEESLDTLLPAAARAALEDDVGRWRERGVAAEVALAVARLPYVAAALPASALAVDGRCSLQAAAGAYFHVGDGLGLARLRRLAASLAQADHWQDRARVQMLQELTELQVQATRNALNGAKRAAPEAAVRAWLEARKAASVRFLGRLPEPAPDQPAELSVLTVALGELRAVIA